MGYPEILHRRIPYDINGTAVGYRASSTYSNGLSNWLSSSQLGELNDEDSITLFGGDTPSFGFSFPSEWKLKQDSML